MSTTHCQLPAEPDPELAQWLVDAGRRRAAPRRDPGGPQVVVQEVVVPEAACYDETMARTLRRLVLGAMFGITALQYLYVDTTLRIAQLPVLVVFASGTSAR
jgi:hypothetical protein